MSDRSQGAGPNVYSYTPRRIFEKAIEKLERKLSRNQVELRDVEIRLQALSEAFARLEQIVEEFDELVSG